MASSFLMPFSIIASTSDLKMFSCAAMIVFITVIGPAQLMDEPGARNSNLLPVKAKGEVRLRSVLSRSISGILPTTFSFSSVFSSGDSLPEDTCSSSERTWVSCVPINMDITAGGASLAPRRWSLDAEAMHARKRSA